MNNRSSRGRGRGQGNRGQGNRGRGPARRPGWNPGQGQRGPDWGSYNRVGREWQQEGEQPGEWRQHVEETFDVPGGDPMGDRLMRDDIDSRRAYDRRRRQGEDRPSRSSGQGYRETDGPFMRSYPEADEDYDRPVGEPYYAEPRAGMGRGRTGVPAGRGRKLGQQEDFAASRGRKLGWQKNDVPRGRYTGVGPEGYTRSDERIREDISERLADAADLDAARIRVEVSGGEVTLSGSVRDRRDRWEAEDIAEDVTGVKQVHNRLRAGGSLGQRIAGAVKDVFD